MSVNAEHSLPNVGLYEPPYPLTPEAGAVIDIAHQLTNPLMTSLQEEYFADRGWMICGPASITDSRLLGAITGLPFQLGGDIPHFEITLGLVPMYLSIGKPVEHAAVKFVNPPADEVVVIDRIIKIATRNKQVAGYDTKISTFSKKWFDLERTYRDGIYEYNPSRCRQWGIDMWGEGRPTTQVGYDEHLAALHSREILVQNDITTPSGKYFDIRKYWGPRLMRTIVSTLVLLPDHLRPQLDEVLA